MKQTDLSEMLLTMVAQSPELLKRIETLKDKQSATPAKRLSIADRKKSIRRMFTNLNLKQKS